MALVRVPARDDASDLAGAVIIYLNTNFKAAHDTAVHLSCIIDTHAHRTAYRAAAGPRYTRTNTSQAEGRRAGGELDRESRTADDA